MNHAKAFKIQKFKLSRHGVTCISFVSAMKSQLAMPLIEGPPPKRIQDKPLYGQDFHSEHDMALFRDTLALFRKLFQQGKVI